MDLLAVFLVKRKLIHSFIAPEALGRWFLYMFRAKFIHKDIHNTPSLKNEKLWCIISHYLIGIILAGIYLFLFCPASHSRSTPSISLSLFNAHRN
jgi:hypothetical protein